MTKAQRLAIWELVLNRLQQKPTLGKMCICVRLRQAQRELGLDGKLILNNYPEFTAKKPVHLKNNFDPVEPWWPLDRYGLSKRIEVVNSIIENL